VRAPVPHRTGEPGVREVASLGVGVVPDPLGALFLGGFARCRGVLVHREHVGTGGKQRFSCFLFLRRVEPRRGPRDLHGGGRVHRTHAEGERIDAAQHFGDRERGDVAELAALARLARGDSAQVARFFHRSEVVAHVVGGLVARRVLEAHVRVLRGNFEHRVHVAERRTHDEVVSVACELVEHGDCLRAFWHVLETGHGDAEFALHHGNALVVLVGPACVAWHSDVHDGSLDHAVVLRRCGGLLGRRCSRVDDLFGRRVVVAAASGRNHHRRSREGHSDYLSSFHSCSPFW